MGCQTKIVEWYKMLHRFQNTWCMPICEVLAWFQWLKQEVCPNILLITSCLIWIQPGALVKTRIMLFCWSQAIWDILRYCWQCIVERVSLRVYCLPRCIVPKSMVLEAFRNEVTQRAHDAMIKSLWRQNDVAMSFWCHNYVIIVSCVRGNQ